MSKVEQFTFQDSGEVVGIRKVSPLLMIRLRERFPMPKPPMQEVDYGDGVKKLEPNPAHPAYREALSEYDQMIEQKARRMLIKRGVVIEWTPERREALEEIRAYWKENLDGDLEPDDEVAFVSYVCVGSDSDLEEFLEALLKRSQPTEAAVDEAAGRFQG